MPGPATVTHRVKLTEFAAHSQSALRPGSRATLTCTFVVPAIADGTATPSRSAWFAVTTLEISGADHRGQPFRWVWDASGAHYTSRGRICVENDHYDEGVPKDWRQMYSRDAWTAHAPTVPPTTEGDLPAPTQASLTIQQYGTWTPDTDPGWQMITRAVDVLSADLLHPAPADLPAGVTVSAQATVGGGYLEARAHYADLEVSEEGRPATRDVRIWEIGEAWVHRFGAAGVVREDNERATVRNGGDSSVDLSGWTLGSDEAGPLFTFPPGTVLKPGDQVHVWTAPVAEPRPGVDLTLGWPERRAWRDEGDTGTLRDADGEVVHVARYGDRA